MLDLLQLGNGAMMPLPDRWLSSFMLRFGRDLILFDCGEGTQIAGRSYGWGFRRISTICFSHWHADHIAGLPGMLFSIANSGRTEPVHIYGPAETIRVVNGLREVAPEMPFDLHIQELENGDHFELLPGLMTRVMAGDHRHTPQLAWRFDIARLRRFDPVAARRLEIPQKYWGRLQRGEPVETGEKLIDPSAVLGPERPGLALGIITDTRLLPEHAPFFQGVDLLISESTYLDPATFPRAAAFDHMTMDDAVALAQTAQARRLLLTHFSPSIPDPLVYTDALRARFPAAEIGYSGWQTTLAFSDDQPELQANSEAAN